MKRQIRWNVFESNSSSMHSLTINSLGAEYSSLSVDQDTNKVFTKFGEFGWGYDVYRNAKMKLSYLVTMLIETHRDCMSLDELCETEDFKKINDAVAEYMNCDGIIIDEEIGKSTWNENCNTHSGYIDHQSICNIDELLEECTIKDFIFDTGIELIIDNDNY